MRQARNVAPDHGLTLRMFFTGALLVALYVAFMGALVAAKVPMTYVLVIGFGMLFAQYWFSSTIAMWGMQAHEVSPEEAPQLHAIVDRLCALADMPKPKVGIAETDVPNAFATGRSPNHAVVCATRGILARLDEHELEGVLAHELSHVAHRDVAVMTFASGVGMLAGLLTRFMFYASLFTGGGDEDSQGFWAAELAIMLVSLIVYAISFVLTRALSRYRELAADRSGALLIGKPSYLASALVKISGEMSRIPARDLRKAEAFNAFFFTPALAGGQGMSVANLFSTHPPLERRLAQLAEIDRQLGNA